MILLVQSSGALLGLLAVVFGAFGAHRLKGSLSEAQQKSFETGVKYQFYHALLLLLLGFNSGFTTGPERYMAWCILLGTLLFSFSIYLLCLLPSGSGLRKILGPVTPIGGLLLVTGWALLLYSSIARLLLT